ncbi:hypothetical protein [Parasphingorhabdus halotolerans]|uniref:Uncharacterized protein n=1 Tax=Parasphingorhabdus halotolerans TaxID=2725558 RepID=A0A6H2DPZ5_9SPHN|nr:hypothetical protein [Parasphingorhabdus halotolerans]QJB70035.1 hypothetical protein HF685_12675 [Parasphingorhabdus halotolerans]
MTIEFSSLLNGIKDQGAINAADVLALRKIVWPDGAINQVEAELLFELNGADAEPSQEWIDFFVPAITEYLINQQAPKGYISEDNAAWLMRHIDHDGRLESEIELELLVRTLEKATGAPASLQAYAIRQIENAVMTGKGPTRCGGELKPGCVTDAEVKILRRVLYAAASEGAISITREEADMLFRLKDATLDAENSPQWKTLFVQLVGNHVMAHNDYKMLDRAEAARLENFMNDNKPGIGGFFSRMKSSDIGGAFKDVFGGDIFGDGAQAKNHVAAVEEARAIDTDEQKWLRERIEADQTTDLLEKALLEFIAEETGRAGI